MKDSFIKHKTRINIFYIHTSHSHKLYKTTDKLINNTTIFVQLQLITVYDVLIRLLLHVILLLSLKSK